MKVYRTARAQPALALGKGIGESGFVLDVEPPRVLLANLPTPLRQRAGQPWLWVKRDQDTGGPLSGNKIRKLEYVVAQAEAAGKTALVTCGGVQSNHCRATALVAAHRGLACRLLLRGQAPEVVRGNVALSIRAGAHVTYVTREQYGSRHERMAELAGDDGFVIDEGASTPRGLWGYIRAAFELADDQRRLGVMFDRIVVAVGSGGTVAGLWLGAAMAGLSAEIVGVCVCDTAAFFRDKAQRLVAAACEQHALPEPNPARLRLVEDYIAPGYGESPPEVWATMDEAAARGLILDPSYTGKAWHGLQAERAAGRLDGTVAFVHTGGVFGLLGA